MTYRSWLFVPGDSERKLAKAMSVGADVVIVDLEDAVAAGRKSEARALARDLLTKRQRMPGAQMWVRINALESAEAHTDLEALVPAAPDGLIVPKVEDPSELVALSEALSRLESRAGLAAGQICLMPIIETPRGVLSAAAYVQAGIKRLRGITWGAEDLAAALGARPQGATDSNLGARAARTQCLLAAKALGVAAVDTVSVNYGDLAALQVSCSQARAEGFTGKLAIHPDQVAVINAAFMPSAEELAWARQIIAAFAAAAGTGAATLNGRMIDAVHLRTAQQLLDASDATRKGEP